MYGRVRIRSGRMGRVGSQVSAVDGSGEDREQERRGEEWKHVSANNGDGMIQVNFIQNSTKSHII